MYTNLLAADGQLLAALALHSTEQNEEPCQLTWTAFLSVLARYCPARDWAREYGDVADYSCAIFAWDAPAVGVGRRKGG